MSKRTKKINLPFTYFNLAWRITVPLIVLVAIGRGFDRLLNLEGNQLMITGIALSLLTTMWGIRYTLKQTRTE